MSKKKSKKSNLPKNQIETGPKNRLTKPISFDFGFFLYKSRFGYSYGLQDTKTVVSINQPKKKNTNIILKLLNTMYIIYNFSVILV